MTETQLTPKIQPLYDYIERIEGQLEQVPPIEQPMRFGNKAFRQWIDLIATTLDADLLAIAEAANPDFPRKADALTEIKEYLLDSFGSYVRIDYGTGHELNFFVFLYCMCKVGFYNVDDYQVLINKVFQRYI